MDGAGNELHHRFKLCSTVRWMLKNWTLINSVEIKSWAYGKWIQLATNDRFETTKERGTNCNQGGEIT